MTTSGSYHAPGAHYSTKCRHQLDKHQANRFMINEHQRLSTSNGHHNDGQHWQPEDCGTSEHIPKESMSNFARCYYHQQLQERLAPLASLDCSITEPISEPNLQQQQIDSSTPRTTNELPTLSGYYECDELSDMVDDSLFEITDAGCLSKSVFACGERHESEQISLIEQNSTSVRNSINNEQVTSLSQDRTELNDQVRDNNTDAQAETPTNELETDKEVVGQCSATNGHSISQCNCNGSQGFPGSTPTTLRTTTKRQQVILGGRLRSTGPLGASQINAALATPTTTMTDEPAQRVVGLVALMAQFQPYDYSSTTKIPSRRPNNQPTDGEAALMGLPKQQLAPMVHQRPIRHQGRKKSRSETNVKRELDFTGAGDGDTSCSLMKGTSNKLSWDQQQLQQTSKVRATNRPIQGDGGQQKLCLLCKQQENKIEPKMKSNKIKKGNRRRFAFSLFNLFAASKSESHDTDDGRSGSGIACRHNHKTSQLANDKDARELNNPSEQSAPMHTLAATVVERKPKLRRSSGKKSSSQRRLGASKQPSSSSRSSSLTSSSSSSSSRLTGLLDHKRQAVVGEFSLPACRLRDSIRVTNQRKLRSSSNRHLNVSMNYDANSNNNNDWHETQTTTTPSGSTNASSRAATGAKRQQIAPPKSQEDREVLLDLSAASSAITTNGRYKGSNQTSIKLEDGDGSGPRGLETTECQQQQQLAQLKVSSSAHSMANNDNNTNTSEALVGMRNLASSASVGQNLNNSAPPITTTTLAPGYKQVKCVKFSTPAEVLILGRGKQDSALKQNTMSNSNSGRQTIRQSVSGNLSNLSHKQQPLPAPIIKHSKVVPKSSSFTQTDSNKCIEELLAKYDANEQLVIEINEKLHLTETIRSNLSTLDNEPQQKQIDDDQSMAESTNNTLAARSSKSTSSSLSSSLASSNKNSLDHYEKFLARPSNDDVLVATKLGDQICDSEEARQIDENLVDRMASKRNVVEDGQSIDLQNYAIIINKNNDDRASDCPCNWRQVQFDD